MPNYTPEQRLVAGQLKQAVRDFPDPVPDQPDPVDRFFEGVQEPFSFRRCSDCLRIDEVWLLRKIVAVMKKGSCTESG